MEDGVEEWGRPESSTLSLEAHHRHTMILHLVLKQEEKEDAFTTLGAEHLEKSWY